VTAADGAVHVTVADDGRRAPAPGEGGQGIIGMRERVGLHRGDFAAGPRPGGGFLVTARLPYADPAAGGTA
jgi:signal transduction histidine kinase